MVTLAGLLHLVLLHGDLFLESKPDGSLAMAEKVVSFDDIGSLLTVLTLSVFLIHGEVPHIAHLEAH